MVKPLLLLCGMLMPGMVLAADITIETDRDPVAMDETFRIIFTVKGKQDGEPDFSPLNDRFRLLGTGQSSTFSMVNGDISRSKSYTLTVVPLQQGKLTIPPIRFGKDVSPAKSITVTASSPTVPVPRSTAPDVPAAKIDQLFVTTEVDEHDPYVQQQVLLKVKIYRRVDWSDASISDPEFEGPDALIQSLGEEKTYQATYKGKRYAVTELRYALFPQESGKLTIQPFRLTARVFTGTRKESNPFGGTLGGAFSDPFFDDFFSRTRRTYETRSASSKPLTLNIKPVPPGFTGSQWLPALDLQLKETWSDDLEKLKAGEPVNRTIALIADGLGAAQLPRISIPDIDNLRQYPDQPVTDEQNTKQGLLTTVTQKIALIPGRPGTYSLPAIEIPWWNTRTNRMEIAKLPGKTLHIAANPTMPLPTATSNPGKQAAAAPASKDQPTAAMSAQPPSEQPVPYQWLLVAVVVLAVLWLVTLLAALKRRASIPEQTGPEPPTRPVIRQRDALSALKSACDNRDAARTSTALIQWAGATWPDDPPTSLAAIARRCPEPLRAHIENLARIRYSQKPDEWDAAALYSAVKELKVYSRTDDDKDQNERLEPLYR